jgi:teichuronic acid biosynthesis glycosyltransferase TuaG
MIDLPLISVIMPCYNSAKYLDNAVRSVIGQSYENWELLICDDGSDDGSDKIAKKWAGNEKRISFFLNQFEKGAPGARNTCLKEARGRYIAFLDSDDEWLPLKLEKQIKFMENTKSSFVFGYCENMSEDGKFLSIIKGPMEVPFWKLIFCNFIPCLTVIYDAQILGKVEQPCITRSNDFALWLSILKHNKCVQARCYPEIVARYRVNTYGLSANKLRGIRYYYFCLRRYADLGILASSACSIIAICFKIMKSVRYQAYNVIVSKLL